MIKLAVQFADLQSLDRSPDRSQAQICKEAKQAAQV
jgi:hypothetical protein